MISSESEYAAWTLVNGYSVNHVTISTHRLKSHLKNIKNLNGFIEDNGFKLNSEGGVLKGSFFVFVFLWFKLKSINSSDYNSKSNNSIVFFQWAQTLYFCKVQRLQIPSRLNSPMASKTRSHVHISSLLNDLCCQNTEIYLKIRLISEVLFFKVRFLLIITITKWSLVSDWVQTDQYINIIYLQKNNITMIGFVTCVDWGDS